MGQKFFLWKFEEYDWNGRTEYKKVVYVENLTHEAALSFCRTNEEFHMDRMENLDHSFEK